MNADTALFRHLQSGLGESVTVARDVPAGFSESGLPLVTVTRTGGDYDGFTDSSTFEVLLWAEDLKSLHDLRDRAATLIADADEWVAGFVAASLKGSFRDDDSTRGLPRWSLTADLKFQE